MVGLTLEGGFTCTPLAITRERSGDYRFLSIEKASHAESPLDEAGSKRRSLLYESYSIFFTFTYLDSSFSFLDVASFCLWVSPYALFVFHSPT
jgi:hypothetical protein